MTLNKATVIFQLRNIFHFTAIQLTTIEQWPKPIQPASALVPL